MLCRLTLSITSLLAIVMSLLTATASDPATVQRRIALVIGNAAYQEVRLQNPVNDATDMAATLRQVGFAVTLLQDATQQTMENAIHQFGLQLRQGGVGLFYYAGHGVQVGGENYLIPIGARLRRETDVRYEAVHLGRVLDSMQDANNGLNLVILDACRNNTFSRRWRQFRSTPLPQGLAVMQAARGTLIAYATEPGGLAADGRGRNGIYTKNLLRYMTTPELAVEHMFRQVRVAVLEETGGKQTPWESSSLTGEFAFVPRSLAEAVEASPVPPAETGPDPEIAMWKLVQDTTQAPDLELFLRTYPESRYAPLARLKLQQLQRQPTAATQPSQQKHQELKTPAPSAPVPPPKTTPSSQVGRLSPEPPQQEERVGRFIKYANATAWDSTTQLMWMTRDFRNIEGRAPDTWREAIAWTTKMNLQRYGGYSDWRIPTLKEYGAIYDQNRLQQSYKGKRVGYPEAFETGGGVHYWTAEEGEDVASRRDIAPIYRSAWSFNYGRGRSGMTVKDSSLADMSVRLVRSGPR